MITIAVLSSAVALVAAPDAQVLGERVAAIQRADYAGDRDELRRLAAALAEIKASELAAFREYWIGFALWRRAINGFNVNAPAPEQRADLEAAVAAFKRALKEKPGWVEAKVGLAGSGSNLLYLAQLESNGVWRQALLDEFVPIFREMVEQGPENPRVLWILGGVQYGAPPPTGGDAAKAAATHRRALEAARREALSRSAGEPDWVPSWGGPENLMNLAYLHTHSALRNRPLALAYAEGALVAVPHWSYVKNVLLPQIEALPVAR